MDDLRDDLDLAAGHAEEVPVFGGAVTVDGDDQANRMLRRRQRLERERNDINALADAEIDRITRWRQDRLDGVVREVEWCEGALESYMRARAARDGIKSLDLPNGRLQLRKAPDIIEVYDESTFLQWAKDLENLTDVVTIKWSARKPGIRAAFNVGPPVEIGLDDPPTFTLVTDDGERVPGVALVRPAEPRFSIPKQDDPTAGNGTDPEGDQ